MRRCTARPLSRRLVLLLLVVLVLLLAMLLLDKPTGNPWLTGMASWTNIPDTNKAHWPPFGDYHHQSNGKYVRAASLEAAPHSSRAAPAAATPTQPPLVGAAPGPPAQGQPDPERSGPTAQGQPDLNRPVAVEATAVRSQSQTQEPPLPAAPFEEALRVVRQGLETDNSTMAIPLAAFTGRAVADAAVRKVLVVSTWRSGSSFLGDMLASQPLAFYLFEPLLLLKSAEAATGVVTSAERRVAMLGQLLRCDYSGATKERRELELVHGSSVSIREACRRFPDACASRRFLEAACAMHPVRIAKTVRMRMRYLEPLLREEPRLRVVLLVRDPRAVVRSRRRIAWCQNQCASISSLCAWQEESLLEVQQLERQFPGQLLTVRYEELAQSVAHGARRLFAFLGVPLEESSVRFLLQHSGQEREVAEVLLGRPGRPLAQNADRLVPAGERRTVRSRTRCRSPTSGGGQWV
ncbi:carbohydrate sulfotransferase 3-like [Pollicipes pollicipes]|uniref:carbohydrate sulfotransferase 3-like n=1 Tax=Pollicipes pollicipes TaxID=41117 RepID=UPI001884A8E9|nr:carbohydrate sulfotransferase 3-like [Pollicipes pollicipes]